MDNIQLDARNLAKNPDFCDLTVEEAIRLIGEKEKAKLNQERDRALTEIKSKIDEKVNTFKSAR